MKAPPFSCERAARISCPFSDLGVGFFLTWQGG
ncbi:MAG: hypothetical protein JWO59_2361 [Chloroflexi bacterium]|nr:hypothetical protein [Chloroflexota bacterium]